METNLASAIDRQGERERRRERMQEGEEDSWAPLFFHEETLGRQHFSASFRHFPKPIGALCDGGAGGEAMIHPYKTCFLKLSGVE